MAKSTTQIILRHKISSQNEIFVYYNTINNTTILSTGNVRCSSLFERLSGNNTKNRTCVVVSNR